MTEVFFTGCPEDDEHRYGHALARYALKKVFGDDRLILRPGHKPLAALPGAHVSISHSLNVCAAAVSDREIGLDIELTSRSADRLIKLAGRFFAADELDYIMADPKRRFYEIWCRKESYVKYTGEGFSRSFPGFSVFKVSEHFSSFEIYGHFGCVCSLEATKIVPKFVDNAEISEYL
ncbi:MAG: 4'-phosphopantetheinyl transferase family protein [Candidatus Flemingiibacterium sp.]